METLSIIINGMFLFSSKTTLIIISLTCATLFSGAIFGWATLQLILEEEGVFSEGCNMSETNICKEQQSKFSLVYSLASTLSAVASFFIGMFSDKYGPTMASLVVSLIYASYIYICFCRLLLYYNLNCMIFRVGFV